MADHESVEGQTELCQSWESSSCVTSTNSTLAKAKHIAKPGASVVRMCSVCRPARQSHVTEAGEKKQEQLFSLPCASFMRIHVSGILPRISFMAHPVLSASDGDGDKGMVLQEFEFSP